MVLLMNVKCTSASLTLKMNGELNTVQITLLLIIVHLNSNVSNVQMLGIVTILMLLPIKLWKTTITTETVKLTLVMMLLMNTSLL